MAQSINVNIRLPAIGTLQIYVNKSDQLRAQRLLDRQPKILRKAYLDASTEFAEKIKRIVKRCISTSTPPSGSGVSWPPHSMFTIKKYGPHKLFYLTGQYYRSIRVSKNKNGTVFVGVPNVLKQRKQGKIQEGESGGGDSFGTRTLNQVAYILEVGTSNIPPRPLWKLAYQAAGANKGYKKLLVKHIRSQIRKEVGGIRNVAL